MKEKKSNFSGSIGFVLAAAGSAVGVGNIWRFPYLCAKDGGGLFLIVYLALVLSFGFVLLTTDIAIGRHTKQNALKAFGTLNSKWKFLGYLTFLVPALIIYRVFADEMGAQNLWVPGTQLNDGIAYDYGEKKNFIKSMHNFENDILVASRNIAKRYSSSKNHIQGTTDIALRIFDSMKKIHGMGARERLLLQIAVQLHDCGKYISMADVAECSYRIIMATEIIGLSTEERRVIASAVRYNTTEFVYYGNYNEEPGLDKERYLLVAKLTAILRLANAMDRSHYQKVQGLRAVLKDRELQLIIDSTQDISLELGLLKDKVAFFEEVFGIRLVLKRKRRV